jgi:hypothetical protein
VSSQLGNFSQISKITQLVLKYVGFVAHFKLTINLRMTSFASNYIKPFSSEKFHAIKKPKIDNQNITVMHLVLSGVNFMLTWGGLSPPYIFCMLHNLNNIKNTHKNISK